MATPKIQNPKKAPADMFKKMAISPLEPKFIEIPKPVSPKPRRQRRKLSRQCSQKKKGNSKKLDTTYDENGHFKFLGIDMCDCLELDCTGCHMPCPKCGSLKCGHECRCNRKWTYDSIETDGSDIIVKNPFK